MNTVIEVLSKPAYNEFTNLWYTTVKVRRENGEEFKTTVVKHTKESADLIKEGYEWLS